MKKMNALIRPVSRRTTAAFFGLSLLFSHVSHAHLQKGKYEGRTAHNGQSCFLEVREPHPAHLQTIREVKMSPLSSDPGPFVFIGYYGPGVPTPSDNPRTGAMDNFVVDQYGQFVHGGSLCAPGPSGLILESVSVSVHSNSLTYECATKTDFISWRYTHRIQVQFDPSKTPVSYRAFHTFKDPSSSISIECNGLQRQVTQQ